MAAGISGDPGVDRMHLMRNPKLMELDDLMAFYGCYCCRWKSALMWLLHQRHLELPPQLPV